MNGNRSCLHIQRMTRLLHLALKCITFTVGQFITLSVKMYYIYGGSVYDIKRLSLLHLRWDYI